MSRVLGVVLMLALALSSCADAAPDASAVIGGRVDAIRLAVERGNTDRALTLLERLERTVERLLANGQLTDEQAVGLVSAAGDVTQALDLVTSEPSPTYSPSPSPGEGHGDEEEEKEHGKGKGRGRGEGGD
jgi:hypothetical protein